MKKKIKQLLGVMLITALFFGCSNPSSGSGDNSGSNPNTPQQSENKYTVTFNFGEYGQSESGTAIKTVEVAEGKTVNNAKINIKSDYSSQLISDGNCWYLAGENTPFNFSTKITSDITLYARYTAAPVKNLTRTIENNTIVVSWDNIPNSRYTIKWAIDSVDKPSVVTTANSYSIPIEGNVSEHAAYTITVQRSSTLNNIVDSFKKTTSIKLNVTDTKWLVLMYMDGDNNLNDALYLDLNEAERGLYENPDKDVEDNIKVVALWDGWNFDGVEEDELSIFETNPQLQDYNVHNLDKTRLLELGADSGQLYANGNGTPKSFELSSATQDLTSSVSWIQDGEVDMSSETTLENFLKWAAENYSAENIILQFSNHGGGPRSAKNNNRRRSMCWDETSGGNGFIKTSDVSKALKAAGYGTDKKVKLIMEDVCLGGSIEESYELKDYAEYYVGSPNNIPGLGFDYISFISSLTSTASIEEVGSKLIASYKSFYEMDEDDWAKILEQNTNLNSYNDLYKSLLYAGSTLSFVDLSKVNAVKEAVNSFASFILTEGTSEDNRIKVYNNKFYDSEKDDVPEGAVAVTKLQAVKYWTAFYNEPIYYQGTFGNLKDLGFMMAILNEIYNDESWLGLSAKTKAVQNALDAAIVACWRDGYNGKPTYYKNPLGSSTTYLPSNLGLGLTINCAVWVPFTQDGKDYITAGFANWYKTDLAFGKECSNWTTLIQTWFPYTGNN